MDDLKERMQSFPAPETDLRDVTRRALRVRRRRVVTSTIVGLVVIAGVGGPLALLWRTKSSPSGVGPALSRVVTDDGVSIRIPRDWRFEPNPFGRTRPKPLFIASTWKARSVGACQRDAPDHGAAIWIEEYSVGKPARPSRFEPRRPGSFADVDPYGGFLEPGCVSGYAMSGWVYRFRDGGRYFEATVAWTSNPPQATIHQVYTVLDSLRVQPIAQSP